MRLKSVSLCRTPSVLCTCSDCQAHDLNVSSSEPMDHVLAAQAVADPPLPWVSRMLPYAEALRKDPQGNAPLPNTGVITSTVTFSCRGSTGSKCVDDSFLKEVLLGLFGPQVRRPCCSLSHNPPSPSSSEHEMGTFDSSCC